MFFSASLPAGADMLAANLRVGLGVWTGGCGGSGGVRVAEDPTRSADEVSISCSKKRKVVVVEVE